MYLRYNGDHVQLTEAEIEEAFGKQDQARIFVRRDLISENDVDRGDTEMLIVEDTGTSDAAAEFGGVLEDINRQGSLIEFIVESFERYARDALPTPGGERWQAASDDVIIQDAIDDVDGVTAGTIQSVSSPLTMVFSHASQAKKMREVETATGGDLKYNSDGSVDYVNRLGTDRTGGTISPGNQNMVGEFEANKRAGQEDVTHLRLVGAGEGAHQVTVNFVPDDDLYNYEGDDEFANVNRYSASHWSSGDRREWDVRSNKDHTKIDSLTRLGETIMADVQRGHVEAFITIKGVNMNLGDSITVEYPEEEINEEMRVIDMKTVIDKSGIQYECDLSTRKDTIKDQQAEDRKDTQRYNKAFEGSPVMLTTGGGRQPVDFDVDYEFSFYYPDEIEYEHRVRLFVKGSEYRAYSQGAASGGDHEHDVEVNHPQHEHNVTVRHPSHAHDIDINDITEDNTTYGRVDERSVDGSITSSLSDWTTVDTYTPSVETFSVMVYFSAEVISTSGNTEILEARVRALDWIPDVAGIHFPGVIEQSEWVHIPVFIPGDMSNVDLDFDLRTSSGISNVNWDAKWNALGPHQHNIDVTQSGESVPQTTSTESSTTWPGTTESTSTEANQPHTHDPEPGVIRTFPSGSFYPQDCDVRINGQTQQVSFGDGDGPFSNSVDIRGELNPGQVNDVTVTSTRLGHIQAHVDIDCYRQILGDG